jgi:hypothetical protein
VSVGRLRACSCYIDAQSAASVPHCLAFAPLARLHLTCARSCAICAQFIQVAKGFSQYCEAASGRPWPSNLGSCCATCNLAPLMRWPAFIVTFMGERCSFGRLSLRFVGDITALPPLLTPGSSCGSAGREWARGPEGMHSTRTCNSCALYMATIAMHNIVSIPIPRLTVSVPTSLPYAHG